MKLLVVLILLKLYARINIFRHTEEKYGQKEIKLARFIEKQRLCITKIECYIKYLLFCKRNNLTPLFARPKFSIRISYYLRNKIGRQILETEINNKYRKKRTLRRQLKENSECLANKIGFICKIILYQKIKNATANQKTRWNKTLYEKINRLKSDYRKYDKPKGCIVKNIIHNFSSYKLTPEEEHALSFSLDDHIPTKHNDIKIETEFESFYYQMLKHTNQLDQRRQDGLKSKVRRTCENYSRINVPYKYQKIIDNISTNKDIILIKQEKGRGVVILDKNSTSKNALIYLIQNDLRSCKRPNKKLENKMQRTLRKIKQHLDVSEYRRMYPTGSRPGLFYTTAKVHKLQNGVGLNELTM